MIDDFAGVQQSVVIAREDTPGVVQLVGYLLADDDIDLAQLRGHIAGMLPDYMVPSTFIFLDTLPKTTSGKVNKH